MPKLYVEVGKNKIESAGLFDIIDWWTETFPEDVFVGKTPEGKLVAEIRELMQKLKAKK